MRSGISTACLYPMLLEKSFSTLISMNFKLFEIFVNTFSELDAKYMKTLKKAADAGGCTVRSVHPFTSGYESFLLFSGYERRFYDSLEFYKRYFEACNILGADILVLHGKRADKNDGLGDERYFERYLGLFGLGKKFGVTVAQENVNMFLSNNAGFICRMKKFCGDSCAFVLDIKQAVRGGLDPFEICSAMGDKIIHLHLNDNDKSSDCLLPGKGCMDYMRLMDMLKGFGYGGDIVTEVYRKSFGGLDELKSAGKISGKLAAYYNSL